MTTCLVLTRRRQTAKRDAATVIIRIDDSMIDLVDPMNFKQFHICVNSPDVDVAAALGKHRVGRIGADGDARLSIDSIRELARGHLANDSLMDAWETQFDEMLKYARSKGWAADGGTEIQAHIVQR